MTKLECILSRAQEADEFAARREVQSEIAAGRLGHDSGIECLDFLGQLAGEGSHARAEHIPVLHALPSLLNVGGGHLDEQTTSSSLDPVLGEIGRLQT